MRRILIYYPKNKLGMSDFGEIDYTTIFEQVKKELDGKFPNVGNKVWLQGITSVISNQDCIYDFGYEELSEEFINSTYDCVLLPLANCFHAGWVKYMRKRTEYIRKIKIPVYVVACGIQANSYDDINSLVEEIKVPATEFISAVYATGGELALRGYCTAEFFEKLGFHDAVVTGCPSLFQMGRDLSISNTKVDKEDFRATINGTFKLPIKKSDIDKSDFICQSTYGSLLYNPNYFNENAYTFKRILRDIKRRDYEMTKAVADERIHLFADTQQWMSYFIQNKISYSFGSRIHGTVMPILSGVPSLLYSCDARTREMAEFFDIPYILPQKDGKCYDIYELYCETNYDNFNKNFKEKFDNYEKFLKKCGLVDNINSDNIFMKHNKENVVFPKSVNKEHFEQLSNYMKMYKWIFDMFDYGLELKNRL